MLVYWHIFIKFLAQFWSFCDVRNLIRTVLKEKSAMLSYLTFQLKINALRHRREGFSWPRVQLAARADLIYSQCQLLGVE